MSRRGTWPYLVLGLLLLVLGLAFWRAVPAGVWHDDGVYVLTGRALAHGHGLRYEGIPGNPPAVKFPPGYPAFLAGLWLLLGSLGPVTLAAELANLVLVAAAGALTAWALHRHAGFTLPVALATAALGFASTDVWRPALVPLSEPLFMFFAAAALAAWGFAARPGDRRGTLALALLLVAAILTRSAALALVLGCGVALARSRGFRAALAATGPALVAAVAWGAFAASRVHEIPEGARDVLGPYGSWLQAQVLGAPRAFLAGLPGEAWGVGDRLASFLLPALSGWLLLGAVLPLVALTVLGVWRLVRGFPPLAWSLAAYLAMLLVWPFVDRRLVAPIHPWVVVGLGWGFVEVTRRTSGRVRLAVIVAAIVWGGAYATATASRAAHGWPSAGYRLRADRLANALTAMERMTPEGAVVGAPEYWPAIVLHGAWSSFPAARFEPRSADEETPVWGSPDQQLRLWWSYGANYLLLEQNGIVLGDALNRLEEACPGSAFILARMPSQMLVRLDWGPECARKLGLVD